MLVVCHDFPSRFHVVEHTQLHNQLLLQQLRRITRRSRKPYFTLLTPLSQLYSSSISQLTFRQDPHTYTLTTGL
jgi:hypothetical protein